MKRALIRAAPWVIGFTVITIVLEFVGILTPFSILSQDAAGVLRGEVAPIDVWIVDIDDRSFETLFHSQRPLDVQPFRALIDAIAKGRPRLIGIDISTADPRFAALRPDPAWPPIVWARDARPAALGCEAVPQCAYVPLSVLGSMRGFEETGCAAGKSCAGVPAYVPDPGLFRTARHYTRRVEIRGLEELPTFPWAVVELCASTVPVQPACRAAVQRARTSANEETIQLTAPNPWPATISAELATSMASRPGWSQAGPLAGHIVLLGATFRSLDEQPVPGGVRSGVWLNAQVVENELLGRPVFEVPPAFVALLDVLIGFTLVYFAARLRFWAALGASAVLVVAVMLLSFLIFRQMTVWLNFVPILVGVALHECTENLREYLHLRRKLAT